MLNVIILLKCYDITFQKYVVYINYSFQVESLKSHSESNTFLKIYHVSFIQQLSL